MKIILSRKGFDSGAGRVPSPIMPNGEMVSLPVPVQKPVPTHQRIVAYNQLCPRGHNLGDLVDCLSHRTRMGVATLSSKDYAHLDPDLDATALKRKTGWRQCFGQDGSSLTHLENQSVGVGDLFLFFGLFRQTQTRNGRVEYDREAKKIHALFGWLQIGAVLDAEDEKEPKPPWVSSHPHIAGDYGKVFIASEHLELNGQKLALPGAGVFPKFNEDLQLTAAGNPCSKWHLPSCFHPPKGKPTLTYHTDLSRWRRLRSKPLVELDVVARGQEFVLDTDAYPEAEKAIRWAKNLIERNRPK